MFLGSWMSNGLSSYVSKSPNQAWAYNLCLHRVDCQAILVPFPQPQHFFLLLQNRQDDEEKKILDEEMEFKQKGTNIQMHYHHPHHSRVKLKTSDLIFLITALSFFWVIMKSKKEFSFFEFLFPGQNHFSGKCVSDIRYKERNKNIFFFSFCKMRRSEEL